MAAMLDENKKLNKSPPTWRRWHHMNTKNIVYSRSVMAAMLVDIKTMFS
jgi:hypothetical protein